MSLSKLWKKIGSVTLLTLFLTAQLCLCLWLNVAIDTESRAGWDASLIEEFGQQNSTDHGDTSHVIHCAKRKGAIPVSLEMFALPAEPPRMAIPQYRSFEKLSIIPYPIVGICHKKERILSCFRS